MAPFSAPFISLDDFFFLTVPHVLCKSSWCSTPSALPWPRKGLTTGFGLKNPGWGAAGCFPALSSPPSLSPCLLCRGWSCRRERQCCLEKGRAARTGSPPAASLCWHLLEASEDILSARALVASPVLTGGSRGFAGSVQPSVTASTQALWQDAACVLLTVGFHCCEAW